MSAKDTAHLATLLFEIAIPASSSLKDKRRVLRSLKERIRNQFNVSVAEISLLDKWQRSLCGVAAIGNDAQLLCKVMNQILDFLSTDTRVTLLDSRIELL